jgi:hypothetical protein
MEPAEPYTAGAAGARATAPLLAAVVVAALLPVSAAAQRSAMTLVDRVAVVVEGQTARERGAELATVWDLFVVANIDIIRRAGPDAPLVPVDLVGISEAQRRVVEQLVALREAGRLGRGEAPPSAVDEARDTLAERIGGHDALHAFLRDRSVSLDSLDEALRREVVVDRFTQDSVHLPAAFDPAELEERFAAGGHPFEGRAYADVAAEFEAWVLEQQFQDYRRLWLVDLRSRCRVFVHDVSEELAPVGEEGSTGP